LGHRIAIERPFNSRLIVNRWSNNCLNDLFWRGLLAIGPHLIPQGGELAASVGQDEGSHAESAEHLGQISQRAGLPPDAPQASSSGKGKTHGGFEATSQAPRVVRPDDSGTSGDIFLWKKKYYKGMSA
jgi:hypothetical protein